ncbi:hypothetical protein JCM3775_003211 [Rhodotorula graminis]|uniref:Actin-related protein 2/3 complex subunit 3 n=1 Tax=Rhodotorula graminis (strain WP1) TaxID=578459 RepID=A0A194S8U8_RHOGW|nr:uncharacterized protein RHOBADRAFT_42366 [Rhodotorula graminis WP1]KPV77153.1 hypothetical protein RHOBADRAFT_42366 [Rhodotorula graminis WP1]
MPAYHSSWNDDAQGARQVGNLALLPFSSRIRGTAPTPADTNQPDIIDESLALFRPNSLFRNFEIKGQADRVLIYLILFIGDCLGKIAQARTWTSQDALKHLTTHALGHFALPGEPGFPMNQVFQGPAAGDRVSSDALRAYLVHARQETVLRLVEQHVYNPQDESTAGGSKPSKWWMAFQKRRFMGKQLGS